MISLNTSFVSFVSSLWFVLSLSLTRADKPCAAITGCKCLVSDLSFSCNLGATDATLHSSFDLIATKRVVQTFDLFDNNNITRISNFFSKNVSFVNINIQNVKTLTTIEENAFWSSVNTTKTFRLTSSSVNSSDTLFKAVSQFVYLSELVLDNNQFETIPDNAFGEHQKQLSLVVLTRNRIRHLGEYAFFPLDSLNYLDLSENLIQELVNNSFAIENTNSKDSIHFPINIKVNLRLNQITEISDLAFSKLKRPTNLDISFNNLTELKPDTFKTILSFDSSKIIVKGNKVKCDCGLNWIFINKTIQHKFSGPLRCADKKYFQNLTIKDFKNCTNYYEIE